MKLTRRMFKSPASPMLFFAILLVATSLYAQNRMQSVLTDQRMVVIPMRSLSEIGTDIDNAMAAKQHALDRRVQTDNRLKEIESAIEAKKTALKDVDRRKDDAKKGKRESELTAQQIETKANQQATDLLERLKDLRKAEIGEAEVAGELADVEIKALRMENELQRKRMEYDSLSAVGVSTLTQSTVQQVLSELEVRLLKLQQDRASATQKLASKQKDIITRRMKLHEAQLKLGMPRA